MTLTKEELGELVKGGAVTDIFKAERAYAILKTVGENADAINASKKNFGGLFGVLQGHAQTEVLIAVARLYDRPSKRYPTRCLQALLDELEAKAEELPPIIEKPNLAKELARQGMTADKVAVVNSATDADVTRAMIAFLRSRLDEPDLVEAIERVKAVRDKRIAHNEAAHGVEGPTWSAVLLLLTRAKEIVGVVGWAYLSTIYIHEGRYFLSSDAQRSGSAMRRVLEGLEIIEPRFPRPIPQPIIE